MKLIDDIYVYEWTNYFDNNCNSYYIGGTVQALIDPGLSRYVPELISSMETDGIRREDIRYIINTHSHPDHFEGSMEFNDNSAVTIALHEREAAFLEETGALMYGWFGLDVPAVSINMILREGPITLGDETFDVILSPGHSPGSLSLYWPSKKALFSGDVIFDRNVGRTDFPGGDGATLKESIRKLSELDIDHLLPGHMGIVEGNEAVKDNFRFVIRNVFPYI
ncbi:MAG: MBL fold metallo-hydrolase [Deltaproteobacteria bacterium]|nr:MBL fold metallo-hydrolase [Deltaproteobacteria bacterium]